MDVVGMVEQKHGKNKIVVSFECETLKADKAAEDHIRQFMPKLAGLDAVGKLLCACHSPIYNLQEAATVDQARTWGPRFIPYIWFK